MMGQTLLWVPCEILLRVLPKTWQFVKEVHFVQSIFQDQLLGSLITWLLPILCFLEEPHLSLTNTLDEHSSFFLFVTDLSVSKTQPPPGTIFTIILTLVLNLIKANFFAKNVLELQQPLQGTSDISKLIHFKGALEKLGGKKPKAFNSQLLIGMLWPQNETMTLRKPL